MSERKVVVDIETYDPNLSNMGSGSIRKDGFIIQVGLLYEDGSYYSCRPNDNSWQRLVDVMTDPSTTKIAHNGIYDYDWIQNGYGITIKGTMEDTMTREGLLYEYYGGKGYGLDACCLRYGLRGKDADSLEAWWKRSGMKGEAIENLPNIPIEIVEEYNEQDCRATMALFNAQQPLLEKDDLLGPNDLECRLYPVILNMRANGIRISQERIQYCREVMEPVIEANLKKLEEEYGITSLTKKKGEGTVLDAYKRLGLTERLFKTPTGGLSVAYDSIVRVEHPLTDLLIDTQRRSTFLKLFINGVFVKYPIGDHIHGTFKPTQRDEGGTLTGRFSSSNPNMQNFPYMKDKHGPLLRSCFIPEDDCDMIKADYSQIEYRLLAHYAVGPGANALRQGFCEGRDYHGIVQEMLGWFGEDGRRRTKNFNFGVVYGMGLKGFQDMFEKLNRDAARERGLTTDQYTKQLYDEYFRKMAFVRPTTMSIQAMVKMHKYIRSIGGRLHRMPPEGERGLYKMVNYLLQGGAAEVNKMGLVAAWEAGCFNVLKTHTSVHDEVVCSMPRTKEGVQAVEQLVECMTKVCEIKVPIKVDPGLGDSWGTADGDEAKARFEEAKSVYS